LAKSKSSQISDGRPDGNKLGLEQLKLRKERTTIEITDAEAAFTSVKVDDPDEFFHHLISSGISKNAVTDARCSDS
tara:strand:+ start:442 stop:669 length:228 start_codon:yes stop_codon:yes gene_type:complete